MLKALPCKTRMVTVKTELFEAQSQKVIARPTGTASETGISSIMVLKAYFDNLQNCQRGIVNPLKRRTGHLTHARTYHDRRTRDGLRDANPMVTESP